MALAWPGALADREPLCGGERPPRIAEACGGHGEARGLGAGKDVKRYPVAGRAWD